ncbi:hypothetical protein D9758_017082 [Tetrapyrgos nigripes]|uniref:Uncharacterized protein n=1 Tax=Tetrapyrgos nigripes TaxID=182062 RepID=A0A8H5BI08_9AGAR|nr:hypothetical protein D9758_017082 [Tetrapyrgos nigripes]
MLAMNVGGEKYDAIVRICQTAYAPVVSVWVLRALIWPEKSANFAAVKAIISSILSDAPNTFIIPKHEDSVREILVEIASYVRHLEKELVHARRHESLIQYQSSPMVKGDSPSQTGPSPSTGDDDSDYSEGELLSQEMAKVRISRMENRHFGKSSSAFLIASGLEFLKYGPAFIKRSEYWVLSPYSIRKSELVETMGISDTQWSENAARQIDSALNNWEDTLPSHLKWDPHGPNNIHLVQSATLHAIYYWIQMHAHRSFIPVLKRGGPVSIKFPSVAICMNAGRSCVNIVDCPLQEASFTLRFHFQTKELQLQLNRQKEILNVYKCLEILRELEKRIKNAGRFRYLPIQLLTLVRDFLHCCALTSDLIQAIVSSEGLQLPFQEEPQETLKRRRETELEAFFDVNAAGQNPDPQLSLSASDWTKPMNIGTFPDEIGSAHQGPSHVYAQGNIPVVLRPVHGLQSVAYDSPNPMESNLSFGSSIPYNPLPTSVDSTRNEIYQEDWDAFMANVDQFLGYGNFTF